MCITACRRVQFWERQSLGQHEPLPHTHCSAAPSQLWLWLSVLSVVSDSPSRQPHGKLSISSLAASLAKWCTLPFNSINKSRYKYTKHLDQAISLCFFQPHTLNSNTMSEATATDIPPAAETTTATPAAAESGPSKTTPAEQTTATTAQDTQQGGDAGTAAAPAAEPPKQQQPEITFKVLLSPSALTCSLCRPPRPFLSERRLSLCLDPPHPTQRNNAGAVWQAEPGAQAAGNIHHSRPQGRGGSGPVACLFARLHTSCNPAAGSSQLAKHQDAHANHPLLLCPSQVEKVLSIAPSMQKLMFKGLLKNDTDTLEKVRFVVGGGESHRLHIESPRTAGVGA